MTTSKGGRGKCAVCGHAEQATIDQAILLGQPSLAQLAKTYGMHRVSLSRHKAAHLNPALVTVKQARSLQSADTALAKVENMIKVQERIIYPDPALPVQPNVNLALAAMREYRATLELYAKLRGELDERPTNIVNIATTVEWVQTRTVILKTLLPFPEAARAVSDALARLAA